MTEQMASEINSLMLDISARLDMSLRNMMDAGAPEFEQYRESVGKLLEIMLFEVMNPIYKEYPQLKPHELR